MTAAQIERRATISGAAAVAILWIVVALVVAAGLTPQAVEPLPVDHGGSVTTHTLPPIEVPTKHRGEVPHDA